MKKIRKSHMVLALMVILLVCSIVGLSKGFAITASAFEQSGFEVDETMDPEIEVEETEENLIMPMSSSGDFKKETDAVIPADTAGFSNRILIPNSDYYRARPNHGLNNANGISGTCGEVAAQLTLSYHNYYSDRRIIENQHLFGSNDPNYEVERNRNPNFSTNPMPMTSEPLGSNAAYHAHLNSNFGHLFGGTSLANVRNGLSAELNRRDIDFTISSTGVLWGLGIFDSVSSTGIKAEINAGRPVPICIAKNLGADGNHWVVAYGYQHINGVFGYIVHYGWTGTDQEFAWINANWASGYISLNIDHQHNYNYIGGQWGERRCTDCQYRQHPFIVDNNGILISLRYYNITGNIVIPDGIRIPSVNRFTDTPITVIGSGAFQNAQMSQISIPTSVTIIDDSAFSGCILLDNITLPSSVINIGDSAFSGCILLDNITLPSNLTNIQDNAFMNCISLTNISLPPSLVVVGDGAFKNCIALLDIVLPNDMFRIGAGAFEGCNKPAEYNIAFYGRCACRK